MIGVRWVERYASTFLLALLAQLVEQLFSELKLIINEYVKVSML